MCNKPYNKDIRDIVQTKKIFTTFVIYHNNIII